MTRYTSIFPGDYRINHLLVTSSKQFQMFNDVLLWKEKMIETEFCFVFDGLERKDMNKFYCKGAFKISHGKDVLTIEFSFFIDEKVNDIEHSLILKLQNALYIWKTVSYFE